MEINVESWFEYVNTLHKGVSDTCFIGDVALLMSTTDRERTVTDLYYALATIQNCAYDISNMLGELRDKMWEELRK